MQLIHTIFEPKGEGPHPTILALHGWGASALDLLGLALYLCNGRWCDRTDKTEVKQTGSD